MKKYGYKYKYTNKQINNQFNVDNSLQSNDYYIHFIAHFNFDFWTRHKNNNILFPPCNQLLVFNTYIIKGLTDTDSTINGAGNIIRSHPSLSTVRVLCCVIYGILVLSNIVILHWCDYPYPLQAVDGFNPLYIGTSQTNSFKL